MDEPIPISLVANTVFCPRRAWLEAAGETVASIPIEEGIAAHECVDARVDDRASSRRSVTVQHPDLGVVGRCDVVRGSEEGLEVVEYKSSPVRRQAEVTPAQVIQLALQRLCLEWSGARVVGQSVYFTTARKSIPVELTVEDFDDARAFVAQTRQIIQASTAPAPLVDDPRCKGCTHAGVCLPEERRQQPIKRVLASNPPAGDVLHVTTPGARVSLRQGRVLISHRGEQVGALPLERVQALVVHGNVDISSGLVRSLLERDVMVLWCTGRGRLRGWAQTAASPNGSVRATQQARTAGHQLVLAQEMVAAKIANQATVLRRNSRADVVAEIARLRALAQDATTAGSIGRLFGVEGEAAAIYFRWLPSMLAAPGWGARWQGRTGRGATDPINVALNLTYGLLLADVTRAVVTCGLDPHLGVLHSPSRNKPALALDLMEQFRPVVADSAVITALNNRELDQDMFTDVLGDVRLRDAGRRVLVTAYERRASAEFTHPTYGYKVTWRRAMEVQARMLLGVLDGTQPAYVGIRVR